MGEYRDELGAAHARIAELEDKVRTLEEAAARTNGPLGVLPELEQVVAQRRVAADEGRYARLRTVLSVVGAFFPLAGFYFTVIGQPLLAASCSLVFVALVVAGLLLPGKLKHAQKELHEAEAKLADARRIAALESELAAKGVRVAVPADVSVVSEEPDDERASAASRAR